MGKEELINSFLSELKRSSLVVATLGVLSDADYGYGLIDKLAKAHIQVEPDTLYPLLRRLESQGLLQGEWRTDTAKPRKYYQRTPLGDEVLSDFYSAWEQTASCLKSIKENQND